MSNNEVPFPIGFCALRDGESHRCVGCGRTASWREWYAIFECYYWCDACKQTRQEAKKKEK